MDSPEEPAATTELAEPAPSLEPAEMEAVPSSTPTSAESETPASEPKEEPTLEVIPAMEPTPVAPGDATSSAEPSDLPEVPLPEFDGSPLELADTSPPAPKANADEAGTTSPKRDDSMAKVHGNAQPTQPAGKASETTGIPLPVKRSARQSKQGPAKTAVPTDAPNEAKNVLDAAPREVDADAFKAGNETPPAIPSTIE